MLLLEPQVFGDERGFFMETYNRDTFAALGIDCDFVQDNHSRSQQGTVRGLHYQLHYPQAKLCRVVQGEVLDVAVDIRRGSPRFGQAACCLLSAHNKRQVFVPRGFAHGFAVLSAGAEFLYKCDAGYHPEDEHGIAYNDPDLAIDWGVQHALLSQRDRSHPTLASVPAQLLPTYNPPPPTP